MLNSHLETLSLIRLARVLQGRSQRRAADAARIGFNRYWRIEHGITKPTVDELQRLAAVLACLPS
jgi:transcriptional regulator with XRE-family HTH domain